MGLRYDHPCAHVRTWSWNVISSGSTPGHITRVAAGMPVPEGYVTGNETRAPTYIDDFQHNPEARPPIVFDLIDQVISPYHSIPLPPPSFATILSFCSDRYHDYVSCSTFDCCP